MNASIDRVIVFHPLALEELVEAMDLLEERRAGLGTKFRGAINEALLFANGRVHRSTDPNERYSVKVARFPYRIHYLIVGNEMRVLAVFHGKRNEHAWQGRRFV